MKLAVKEDLVNLNLPALTLEQEIQMARRKDNRHLNKASRDQIKMRLIMSNMEAGIAFMRRCCRGKRRYAELVSLTFSALSKAVEQFKPRGYSFLHYARNYLRGEVMREWKHEAIVKRLTPAGTREYTEDCLISSAEEKVYDEPQFGQIEGHVMRPILKQALSTLTVLERTIVLLHHEEGLSFQDIATKRGVCRSAVQATHARAILKLRRYFHKKKIR